MPVRAERQFKQQRAAATYEALLRAAATVFARRGYDAAQTPEIAACAGVSTGAFYRYFSDKRQAFVELMADHLERAHAEVMAELEPERFLGADPRGTIAVALEVVFGHFRKNAELYRVYLAMSLRDPDVQKLRANFEAKGRQALAALIRQVIPAGRVYDPDAAAAVIVIAVLEAAAELTGLRPHSGPAPGERAIKQTLIDLIDRYLFAPLEPARRRRRRR